jgi:hypothetical protein
MNETRRSTEEMVDLGAQFLARVAQVGTELGLNRGEVMRLFGVFAAQCVQFDIAEGRRRNIATVERATQFMQGLGMPTVAFESNPGDGAGANEHAARHGGPLQ